MKPLFNHTSLETAYKVSNYPYGYTLRTDIFYWIETTPKRGDRFCSATLNPKNWKMNAPKKSTYSAIAILMLNEENGHIRYSSVHQFDGAEAAQKLIESVGIENLNKEQRKQYNQLMGINEVKIDEFTGAKKKDFSVKWERQIVGAGWKDGVYNRGEKGNYIEVKITFDRPDGVTLKEIFEAMKTLNQDNLNQVFEVRDYGRMGHHAGTVRICVRGGMSIGTVSESSYKNYLASDVNINQEEAA